MIARRSFSALLVLRAAKLAVGLLSLLIYGRIFGVSATYDAWVWALGIVNAVGLMLFGPITETVRAVYAGVDEGEGKAAAENYLGATTMLMVGGSFLLAMAGWGLISVYQPRSGLERETAAFLTYLLPSLVLSQMVSVMTAHLNCHGVVMKPEIAGVAGGLLGAVLLLVMQDQSPFWLLLASYYIILFVPLLLNLSFWPNVAKTVSAMTYPEMRARLAESTRYALPLFLPYALFQASILLERHFALLAGTGVLSILSYALFARNTVQAVFTTALTSLAVPSLARSWNGEDRETFRAALKQWTSFSLRLATMGMIILFAIADMAAPLIFGAGATPEDGALLALLLRTYAVAMIAVVLYLAMGSALLAARMGKSYAASGVAASIVAMLMLVALFPRFGVVTIPVTLLVSHLLAALFMARAIDKDDWKAMFGGAMLRMASIGLLGSLVAMGDAWLAGGGMPLLPRLAAILGIALLVCAAWWLVENRIANRPLPLRQALGEQP